MVMHPSIMVSVLPSSWVLRRLALYCSDDVPVELSYSDRSVVSYSERSVVSYSERSVVSYSDRSVVSYSVLCSSCIATMDLEQRKLRTKQRSHLLLAMTGSGFAM